MCVLMQIPTCANSPFFNLMNDFKWKPYMHSKHLYICFYQVNHVFDTWKIVIRAVQKRQLKIDKIYNIME